MPKKKLTGRITAAIDLPHSFLEGVFGSFSIFRAEGEDRCVRYAIGDEALRCFLPVFDHRPTVLSAAKAFDAQAGPEAALALVSRLLENADVEVGRRTGKGGAHPFLTLLPAAKADPRYALRGEERDFDLRELREGMSCDGRDAVWYWLGVLPRGEGGEGGLTDGGLKLVHLSLGERRE